MPTGGRKTQLQVLHEISVQIGPNSGVGGLLGVLPAGSILHGIHTCIPVAFNSTTNLLSIGTTPGGSELQGGISMLAPVRTDLNMTTTSSKSGPYAVDTPIYWSQAFTGAAPTTGLAVAYLEFVPGPG